MRYSAKTIVPQYWQFDHAEYLHPLPIWGGKRSVTTGIWMIRGER